ncbi:hypothetical protein BKA81DRAFT_147956 [Phyllosticta paracitricarpa]|uniref:Uncharacterized protein n=1 Tax=Phyllosticta paracitricarpa TaxID=2016321 RepID=A0ABR1NGA7_9PEZI
MPPIASVSRRERTSEQKSLFDILHLQASEQNASITTTPLSPFWQPFGSSLGAPVHHAAKSGQHFSHSPHHRFRQSVYRARRTCLRSLSTHLALAYIARTVPLYLHWVVSARAKDEENQTNQKKEENKVLSFPSARQAHAPTHPRQRHGCGGWPSAIGRWTRNPTRPLGNEGKVNSGSIAECTAESRRCLFCVFFVGRMG